MQELILQDLVRTSNDLCMLCMLPSSHSMVSDWATNRGLEAFQSATTQALICLSLVNFATYFLKTLWKPVVHRHSAKKLLLHGLHFSDYCEKRRSSCGSVLFCGGTESQLQQLHKPDLLGLCIESVQWDPCYIYNLFIVWYNSHNMPQYAIFHVRSHKAKPTKAGSVVSIKHHQTKQESEHVLSRSMPKDSGTARSGTRAQASCLIAPAVPLRNARPLFE